MRKRRRKSLLEPRKSIKEQILDRLKELRINRFKVKHISKYIMIVAIILVAILLFPSTLSMYSSDGEGDADVDIAYSLLHADSLSSTIRLENIVPSDDYQNYDFVIRNYEDDDAGNHNIIDVNMKYYVDIKATTNLPIEYILYDDKGTMLAKNTDILEDEYATKWFELRSKEYVATFNADYAQKFTCLLYTSPSPRDRG